MGEIFPSLPQEPNSGLGVLIAQPSSATMLTQTSPADVPGSKHQPTTLVTFLPLSHKPQGAIRAQPLL